MDKRESETLEFKKSTAQLREAVISLCAMLNKHEKGKVYFGIKDDGTICGQQIGKRTTSEISHEIRNNLKPMPEVNIDIVNMEGKNVIEIKASGVDTPYSAYGRYYTRVDDSDVYMDSKQLWQFFESKDRTYSKWEEKTTPFGVDNINEELLLQYIRDANDAGRMHYIYRNPTEALGKLNLISDEGFLNNAGYYLFGNDGPITLKEVVYPTDSRETFTDLRQFQGNIFECIDECMKYIQNNMHYSSEFIGPKRVDTPEVPIKAIREIVINSFAHCHYQKGDYNEVAISRSRIRIYNPGGILNDTSPVDFANGKIGSKIRNPLIATVLFKNGLIDAFGTGFDRTFNICDQNGVDYEYSNDEYGFTFIFKRSCRNDKINTAYDKLNDKIFSYYDIINNEITCVKEDKANYIPTDTYSNTNAKIYDVIHDEINAKINIDTTGRINKLDESIIQLLSANSYLTIPEISVAVGKSEATVYRHLDKLVSQGRLERVGSRKTGYWKVKSPLYNSAK